jgi:Zn-finger nucleic acid-binding protein
MHCPQCKGYELEPVELETGLIAAGCLKCDGQLLSMTNYRFWAKAYADAVCEVDTDVAAEDSSGAKLCPKCSRFMSKYKIGNDSQHRLELCTGCDEVWLDKNEWQLLKKMQLHGSLGKVFTDSWQRELRLAQQRESLDARYRDQLGDETFAKAKSFKHWLEQQPQRADILLYLQTKI